MGAAMHGEGLARNAAVSTLALAFCASLLLHAAALGMLQGRDLSAREPPEPVTLIARFMRPEPPPAPLPIEEDSKPVPAPSAKRAPVVIPAAAPLPVPPPAPETPSRVPASAAPEPAPAPAADPVPVARLPLPAAAPAPAPDPPTVDPGAVARFRLGLIGEAAGYKRYPRVAIENNWQGEVLVSMSVGEDGRIAGLRVARSSGHDVLDRQALDMFRAAYPRVAIPGALRGRAFELELRAVYSLRDQRSG